MTAGGGDLDGATERVLALDLGEVAGGHVGAGLERDAGGVGNGFQVEFAFEKTKRLVERLDRKGGDAIDERGFVGGGGREEDAAFAELFGKTGEGEGAADGAGRAGEAEFAGDQVVVEAGGLELFGGDEDADGDGQVVERAFFAEVAGRKIDGGAGAGDFKTAVAEGGDDAVVGFLHRGVGETDKDACGIDFAKRFLA